MGKSIKTCVNKSFPHQQTADSSQSRVTDTDYTFRQSGCGRECLSFKCSFARFLTSSYPFASKLHPSTCITWESIFFSVHRSSPTRARAASYLRFLDHIQRHATVGRTPLDERSVRRRDLYLTTHTALTRDTHPCKQSHTHELDCWAAAVGLKNP
jgi:hypothetical protein